MIRRVPRSRAVALSNNDLGIISESISEISRINTYNNRWHTLSGIGVGSIVCTGIKLYEIYQNHHLSHLELSTSLTALSGIFIAALILNSVSLYKVGWSRNNLIAIKENCVSLLQHNDNFINNSIKAFSERFETLSNHSFLYSLSIIPPVVTAQALIFISFFPNTPPALQSAEVTISLIALMGTSLIFNMGTRATLKLNVNSFKERFTNNDSERAPLLA